MFHLDSGKQGQLIELGLTGNYPTSILKRNFVFWLDSHRYTSLSPFLLWDWCLILALVRMSCGMKSTLFCLSLLVLILKCASDIPRSVLTPVWRAHVRPDITTHRSAGFSANVHACTVSLRAYTYFKKRCRRVRRMAIVERKLHDRKELWFPYQWVLCVALKPGFHIVVSVVSVVRKKFIGQI